MAETKTKPTRVSVEDFLSTVADERKVADSRVLIKMMSKITGEKPYMWGPSIIAFGTYHYKYDSGHEGDACIAGFSPRKGAMTIYLMSDFETQLPELVSKLGKYKASKACLYVKKLDDIDLDVLEQLVRLSMDDTLAKYPRKYTA